MPDTDEPGQDTTPDSPAAYQPLPTACLPARRRYAALRTAAR